MAAALCALHDLASAEPEAYRNLVPSFVSILKQVRGGLPGVSLRGLTRIAARSLSGGCQSRSTTRAAARRFRPHSSK